MATIMTTERTSEATGLPADTVAKSLTVDRYVIFVKRGDDWLRVEGVVNDARARIDAQLTRLLGSSNYRVRRA